VKITPRLRYRFDNLMARGVGAQILLLAVATLILILVGALATVAFGVRPAGDDDAPLTVGGVVWATMMHALDPGMIGGDSLSSWLYLAIMLAVTLGGVFVVSALIGVLNQGFGELLEGLRRGRSAVVEQGHTVILGWSSKVFPLLAEFAEANANQRDACVVVLADRDKVEMDDEIAAAMGGAKLRVVTRRGDALTIDDLALAALPRAKAVVVLAPERHPDGSLVTSAEADAVVLKSLLAIRKTLAGHPVHVVAEILDERTEPVARTVIGEDAGLVLTGPLISRLLVQTGRQAGLSDVYGELLDFAGSEIYVTPADALAGRTFREAVFAYDTSSLIGVLTAAGQPLLPPPLDRRFEAGDQVLTISEDDDTVLLNGTDVVDPSAIVAPGPVQPPVPERTLVLGSSPRLPMILRELDGFLAPGSTAVVVGEGDPLALVSATDGLLRNLSVSARSGDVTDRGVLEGLDVAGFDQVVLLSEVDGRSQDMADARTIVTLLYLRDIVPPGAVPIISEILDVRNRDLAAGGDSDDFIVSSRLVSLVISQIAENPHLGAVLDDLLSQDGHELYLRPAMDYVRPGEVTFGTVCEAALRRGEIAIGYRPGTGADRTAVVNPAKHSTLMLGPLDQIVVLAEA
jgi:ion channel POLLUX/CASTOR